MNKAVKRRAILCSLLTIALCISLVAGVSFALFHGTAGGSVSISAGEIKLSAEIGKIEPEKDEKGNQAIYASVAEDDSSKLIIKNVSSGYGVKFNINVKNDSTIPVKYRIKFITGDGNLTLFDAMQITIDGVAKTKTSYKFLSRGTKDDSVSVSVYFEKFDINAVPKEGTCELSYEIEAVQANASVESESRVISVRTPHEFIWALDEVLAGESNANTIKLIDNIDLRGSLLRSAEGNTDKTVTIDGNGKNITLDNSLFEELNGGKYVFNNITFNNPDAQAASRVALMSVRKVVDVGDIPCTGAIAGSIVGNADVTINGCKVKDRNFKGSEESAGAGAFVGSVGKGSKVTFEGCSVENSNIKGGSTGYFVGKTSGEITFKGNCSASESTVEKENPDSNSYVGSVEASSGGEGETGEGKLPDVKVTLADGVYLNNGVYEIYDAYGLLWLDEQCRNGKDDCFFGKTVVLIKDIDFSGVEFHGIGDRYSSSHPNKQFNGTFDGQGFVVKNMTVENLEQSTNGTTDIAMMAGFFNGLTTNAIVKNIKFDNATVSGHHYVGVIAGYIAGGAGECRIENCSVINSNVSAVACELTLEDGYDFGDKAGAIVGYFAAQDAVINRCSVSKTMISAYRDLAAICGYANIKTSVTDCTVGEGVNIIVDNSHNYKNYASIDKYDANDFVGERVSGVTDITTGNSGSVESIYEVISEGLILNYKTGELEVSNANGWVALKNVDLSAHGTIKLVGDLNMTGIEYTPIILDSYTVNIDGNYHFITGLSASLFTLINDGVNLDLTVKDLIVKNSTVEYRGETGAGNGVIIDHIVYGSLAIESCGLNYVTVNGAKDDPKNNMQVGGFVGHVADGSKLSVKSSYVINSTINGNSSGGGIFGYTQSPNEIEIEDCVISNITVTSRDDGSWRIGAVAGTLTADSSVKLSGSTVSGVTLKMENSKAEDPGLVLYGRALGNSKFIVDGKKIIADGVALNAEGEYEISTAAGLFSLQKLVANGSHFEGETFKLTEDIYLSDKKWTPIGDHGNPICSFRGTFDGNGKKIDGLTGSLFQTIDVSNEPAKTVTVKNLKLTNVAIDGTANKKAVVGYGAFIGDINNTNGGKVVLSGCSVEGGSIKAWKYAGGLIGHAWAIGAKIEITACSVIGVEISTEDSSVGGFIGHSQSNTTISCGKVSGVTVSCLEDRATDAPNNDAKAGLIIGTINQDTVKISGIEVDGILNNDNAKDPLLDGWIGRIVASGNLELNGNQLVSDGVTINAQGEYEIFNLKGLIWFRDQVNENNNGFGGKTVRLTADIDCGNDTWLPIGENEKVTANIQEFYGTFDGGYVGLDGETKNHVIKNLNIEAHSPDLIKATLGYTNDQLGYGVGFFGWLTGIVKNVTFENVKVSGYNHVGVIAGHLDTLPDSQKYIENCQVIGCTVIATHHDNKLCGDKVGGALGFLDTAATISNVVVKNTTVTAGRDAGQVIGFAQEKSVITECTVEGTVEVTAGGDCTGANVKNEIVGRDARK